MIWVTRARVMPSRRARSAWVATAPESSSRRLAIALRSVSTTGGVRGSRGRSGGLGRRWRSGTAVTTWAAGERRDGKPLRYLAIRIRPRQGEFFEDGSACRYYAVVTNREEEGGWVLRWHRQKAGTVEHVHDELKNALAAGAMPSQRFGANAAWFMLNAMAYNLVSAIRAGAPDGTLRTARLKQLRYQLFHVAARSARDRRKISVRFAATAEWIRHLISLFQVFPLRTISTG